MKKHIIAVAAMAAVLGFSGVVSADGTTTFKNKAGITPDNVVLYPLDKAIERIQLKLASDPVKQVELLTDFAEERLGESEEMAAKGKEKYEDEALNDYKDKISQAADKVKTEAQDSVDKDQAIQKKIDAIDQRLTDLATKSDEILNKLGENASANAKATIQAVVTMQTDKLKAMKAVFEAKKDLIPLKTDLQKAKEALDTAKSSGDSDAITAAQTALDSAQKAYNDGKAAVKTAKEAVKTSVNEIRKAAGENTTTTDVDKSNDGNAKGAENSNKVNAQQNKGQQNKEQQNKGQQNKAQQDKGQNQDQEQ